MFRNILFGFFLYLLLPSMVYSQPDEKVYVGSLKKGELFNKHVKVFESFEDLAIEEALSKINDNSITISNNKISQGFSENLFWIYFDLFIDENSGSNTEYLLELDNPHIDKFSFYKIIGDDIENIANGGDHYPYANRSFDSKTYVMPLIMESGKNSYILRIDKRNSSVRFPLLVWEKSDFEDHQIRSNIIHGIFFAFIFLVVLTSLGIAYLFMNKLFAVYSLYVLLAFLFIFTTIGYSFKYLYPGWSVFNDYVRLLLTLANIIVSSYYISLFLNLAKYRARNITALKWCGISLLLIFVVWLVFPGWVRANGLAFLNLIYFHILAVGLILIVSAIQVYPFEKNNVVVFFVSFSFAILGSFGFMLIEYGVVPSSFFILDPVTAGLGMEILILSTVMGKRVKKISFEAKNIEERNEKLQAQTSILESDSRNNPDATIKLDNSNVNFSQIKFIESDGHYLRFSTTTHDRPIMVRMTIKEALAKLQLSRFTQIHRSYIVNIDFVKIMYASKLVLKDNTELPVSRSFKNGLQKLTLQT